MPWDFPGFQAIAAFKLLARSHIRIVIMIRFSCAVLRSESSRPIGVAIVHEC